MSLAQPSVLVIAGPTASGKSALALALAERLDGVVINADSQQSYRDLPILTARPRAAEEARVPHRLFGTLGPMERDSAAAWALRAATEVNAAIAFGKRPIVVGGTGLYLKALMIGMPPMPAISEAARDAARALLDEIGHAEFHARLAARDPVLGAKLKVGDTQRILRAWEVVEATGRPLSAWQADAPEPPIAATFQGIAILPPREVLNAAGDTRFEGMLATGALEEVRALRATGIAEVAPIWRVLGARPLIQHIQGEIDLKAAAGLAKTATRQYAKRQTTWFRHHFDARLIISEQYSERLLPDIFPKVRNSG